MLAFLGRKTETGVKQQQCNLANPELIAEVYISTAEVKIRIKQNVQTKCFVFISVKMEVGGII